MPPPCWCCLMFFRVRSSVAWPHCCGPQLFSALSPWQFRRARKRWYVESYPLKVLTNWSISVGLRQPLHWDWYVKLTNMVQVVRDGAQKEIEASELVVRDIVLIRVGDKTPADIRMLECHSIKVIASGVKEPCLLLHQRSGGSLGW